jgi:hypothetical protein
MFMILAATASLATFGSSMASAQEFRVRIGDDGPRHHREVREYRRGPVERIVERRVVRPRARTVCRTVIRERVRGNGVVVRRPVEECRTMGPRW